MTVTPPVTPHRVEQHLLDRPARPVRTPTVLQMEETECGAASLGIILGYLGRDVPLTELRAACGVSRDGSRARDVLAAARSYGLNAEGHRRPDVEKVARTQPPFIAYWDHDHFLVVEGFAGDRVRLSDPARGRVSVTREEFGEHYSGLILLFDRGPDFQPHHVRGAVRRGLARRMQHTAPALVLTLLSGLALAILSIATAVVLQVFVNQVLVQRLPGWAASLGLLLAGILVLQVTGVWLQQALLLRLSTKLSLTMSSEFLWHLLRLPTGFYAQRNPGGLVARVQLADSIAQLLAGPVANASVQVVSAIIVVAVMAVYSVPLTLVALVIAGVNVVVLLLVSRARGDANQRVLNEQYHMNAASFGAFARIETMKASGTQNETLVRLTGPQARLITATQSQGVIMTLVGTVPGFLGTVNTTVILGLGALMVMDGSLTIGAVLAFLSLVGRLLSPLSTLVSLGGSLQDVRAQLTQMDDVLANPIDPLLDTGTRTEHEPCRLTGRLDLRAVTFGYSRTQPPLIRDLDLTLTPGSRVALVGGSGSGKSTIGALVAGLYQPWSGEVLLDGRPLVSWPRTTVTTSVAHVDQQTVLFDASVRDNLTFWDHTIADRAVVQACRDAQIADVVERLPGAYAAPVRRGGAEFSGGQRQRLAIARALAVDPALIILDEATSALDAATEYAIDQALRRRGVTCLIVAHRLSTIRDADEILVLDGGRIVERGTHDELMRTGDHYRRLVAD